MISEDKLKQAIIQIHEALEIAREFKNLPNHTPAKEDLKLLEQLSWNFWMGYELMENIKASMANRYYGVTDSEPQKRTNNFQWIYRRDE